MRPASLLGGAACAALSLALAGCAASASPDWDARMGDRARILRAQQVIDPAAPTRNAQATPAQDGRTTREAMGRHMDSYRTPPPANITNISIGGGSSTP